MVVEEDIPTQEVAETTVDWGRVPRFPTNTTRHKMSRQPTKGVSCRHGYSRLGGQFLTDQTGRYRRASHLGSIGSSPIGTDLRQLDSSTGHQSGCHGCSIVEQLKSRRRNFNRAGQGVLCFPSPQHHLCTILPVSTAAIFRRYGRRVVVETDRFDRLQSCMFTPLCRVDTPPLSKSN
jgi:hypothetical protein